MKVAIVAESIYTFVSGAAVFTKRLIDQLSPNVEEVIVITAGKRKEFKKEGNIKIYSFPTIEIEIFKNFPVVLTKLREIKKILKSENVDVVHIQLPSPLCIAASYYAKQLSLPVVVTSHTQPDNVLNNLNIYSEYAKKMFYRYIARVYHSADYIVFGSEHGKKEILMNGLNKNIPSEVISSIVDTSKFFPKGKRKKKILFVGRLMKEKNIETLIRASKIVSKSHPEYEYVIAGDGYLKSSLEDLAGRISPKITFTGYVSDEELVKLYQSSEIFVLPSESELLGLVLLEAMACGMVTIASDSEKSAAGEISNLKFKHKDYNDLAKKILTLIDNPKKMKELSLKNKEEIMKNHNYKKIISMYLEVYKKVINSNKNKRIKRKIKKISPSFMFGFLSSKYFGNDYPLWIDFRTTCKCNLRCIYCDLPNQNLKEMTLKEIKTVIDKIDTKSWILMTGGEPLIRKDIGEIIDYIVFNTPHIVVLNTNLLLLEERYNDVKNCDGFYFSLDGTKETHEKNKGKGTWNKVIESLELLHKEKRGKISMTVVTSNTTLEDIKGVLSLAKKYDILPSFQSVRHYSISGDSKEYSPQKENALKIFDYLIEQRKRGVIMTNSVKGLIAQKKIIQNSCNLKCYSGKLFCIIDSDGVLGLCFSRPRNKEYLNLKDSGVTFRDALRALKKVKSHTKRCDGCSCMSPIEFSLAGPWNLDVVNHNNQSFSRFIKLENEYIKNQRLSKRG